MVWIDIRERKPNKGDLIIAEFPVNGIGRCKTGRWPYILFYDDESMESQQPMWFRWMLLDDFYKKGG